MKIDFTLLMSLCVTNKLYADGKGPHYDYNADGDGLSDAEERWSTTIIITFLIQRVYGILKIHRFARKTLGGEVAIRKS